jgi:hypothetical protein
MALSLSSLSLELALNGEPSVASQAPELNSPAFVLMQSLELNKFDAEYIERILQSDPRSFKESYNPAVINKIMRARICGSCPRT